VQEQSLKLFKRTYILGDPQKLEDFDTAMQALKNVRHDQAACCLLHQHCTAHHHVSSATSIAVSLPAAGPWTVQQVMVVVLVQDWWTPYFSMCDALLCCAGWPVVQAAQGFG
jgi:hypothetical protein